MVQTSKMYFRKLDTTEGTLTTSGGSGDNTTFLYTKKGDASPSLQIRANSPREAEYKADATGNSIGRVGRYLWEVGPDDVTKL